MFVAHRFIERLALVILWGAAGCEAGDQRQGSTADKQELIVGAGEDEFGLQLNRHRLGIYPLNAAICEPLLKLTHDFQTTPGLATSWNYLGDNTYRLALRRGVTFHDGRPLDAASVKNTLDRSVELKTQYSFLSTKSVQVVDDSTIDIQPSIPNLRLIDQLVHPTYSVIEKGTDPSVHPVCTGPFKFVEYVPNNHLTVVRNDAYWGAKAKLARIIFRFIPDDNSRALALRSGELDAIFDVNRSMVAGLMATPGLKIVTTSPGSVMLLYIATHGAPGYTRMGEPVVRRAIAMAIDRESLVKGVLEGRGAVVNTVNPPTVLGGYAGLVHGIPYNPAKARQLLDSAGWKAGADGVRNSKGQRLRLVLVTQGAAVDRAVPQYIQAQLALIGVELKLEQLDAAAWESRINSGTFDLDIEIPNQNDANPAFLLALRWYSRSNVRSLRFMAAGARYDSLVALALSAPTHEGAQRFAAEAMHVLVDEDVVAIPLAGVYRIYAMKERVKGFDPHPSRANQWWNTVWMSK